MPILIVLGLVIPIVSLVKLKRMKKIDLQMKNGPFVLSVFMLSGMKWGFKNWFVLKYWVKIATVVLVIIIQTISEQM